MLLHRRRNYVNIYTNTYMGYFTAEGNWPLRQKDPKQHKVIRHNPLNQRHPRIYHSHK